VASLVKHAWRATADPINQFGSPQGLHEPRSRESFEVLPDAGIDLDWKEGHGIPSRRSKVADIHVWAGPWVLVPGASGGTSRGMT
jgi:hypothetical protein